jgi:hypothetical protein
MSDIKRSHSVTTFDRSTRYSSNSGIAFSLSDDKAEEGRQIQDEEDKGDDSVTTQY